MNINPKIFTTNDSELASYALFHDMIKVMKAADGAEPIGACCGRNTKQIINLFISNKQKYFDFMKNINTRLIKPLRKGVVYISPMKKMLSYELMTDNEILLCVKKGYLSDKIFDWTEYNKAQKPIVEEKPVEESPIESPVESPAESPITEETPAMEPTAEESPVVESPAEKETPAMEPIDKETAEETAEETPAMEPIDKETPVEKPKRSAKKGLK